MQKLVTDAFYRYDREDLIAAIRDLGFEKGDSLLVHGAFRQNNGFEGSPKDVIDCLLEAVGEEGNLLMVSMPYLSSTYDYLKEEPLFDVKRTISKMGIISETFRRRKGVLRSLHPTHPVLAIGKDASWIVRDHEKSPYPCGENTPFGKFRALHGKVLFFDVPFGNFTFIHYIEDRIRDRVPFEIYRKDPLPGRVRDSAGTETVVPTFVFSEEAVKSRRPKILESRLRRMGVLKERKIGRTRLLAVKGEDAVRCAEEMLHRNEYFYESGTGVGDHGASR